ncbi:porin [Paraburkholderia tropica]|uniref:porin n=1 Tax=Paraburkholderia tropica TaxID=92647 RepID=UPI002AB74D27|nr:porin [Paraburkholderia tropica]
MHQHVTKHSCAAAIALIFCANAHAQSSVTLYGLIDAGVAYVSHAGATTSGSNAAWRFGNAVSGNRWGLKGNEDLGGGLAALFQLEGGYSIGTGAAAQGGREFGRTSIVGLSSQRWGTIKLGRQYDPLVDMVSALTEDAYFGLSFGTPGDVDNYDGSMRVNNSAKYISPKMGGVQIEALYGFGGQAGSTGAGQTWSVAAAYASGPLSLAAGYYYADGGSTVGTNGKRTWTSSADSPFNTAINAGFATAHSVSIARAAAQYQYGALTGGLGYSHTEYASDADSLFTDSARFNSGSAFVNWQFTPAARMGVGYHYTWLAGADSAHYHQVNAAFDYSLSKRTDVYALAAFQRASGTTRNASGASIPAQAVIGDYGVSSGSNTQTLLAVGVRQRF